MPGSAGQVERRVVELVVLIDHKVFRCGLQVKNSLDDLILVILRRQMDDCLVILILPLDGGSSVRQEHDCLDVTLGRCRHDRGHPGHSGLVKSCSPDVLAFKIELNVWIKTYCSTKNLTSSTLSEKSTAKYRGDSLKLLRTLTFPPCLTRISAVFLSPLLKYFLAILKTLSVFNSPACLVHRVLISPVGTVDVLGGVSSLDKSLQCLS